MARDGRAQQLSLFILLFGVGHVLCQLKYVETGTNYTFDPKENAALDSVLWKFKNDKVVEFEDGGVKWFQFEKQGVFDKKTGVLTLNGLMKSQSGRYESEILVSGILQSSKYDIKVIDAVQVPQVKCNKNTEGRVTSLECFLQPEGEEATFTWTGPGEEKNTGKTFQITNETMKYDAIFYCTAENPLGTKGKELNLRECYPAHEDNTGAIAGVVSVVLVLLGVAGVFFWRKKRTRAKYNAAYQKEETMTGQEGSNNTGHETTDKENAEQEDEDHLMSDSPKTDLSNTVINVSEEELNEESAEEAQGVPKSAEKGQGATTTVQESEDQNNMAQSNGDPSRDEGPNTAINFSDELNEEGAEGQNQSQDAPFSVDINPGNEDNGS